MRSMMDSTLVVVMLMILLVLLLIGVLVFARVLAHREARRRPEPPHVDTPAVKKP